MLRGHRSFFAPRVKERSDGQSFGGSWPHWGSSRGVLPGRPSGRSNHTLEQGGTASRSKRPANGALDERTTNKTIPKGEWAFERDSC